MSVGLDVLYVVLSLALLVGVKYARDYLIVYLRKHREEEVWKITWYLVVAAEQYLDDGSQKFEWVFDLLQRQFPDLDTEMLRAFIEAAVFELNRIEEEVNQ